MGDIARPRYRAAVMRRRSAQQAQRERDEEAQYRKKDLEHKDLSSWLGLLATGLGILTLLATALTALASCQAAASAATSVQQLESQRAEARLRECVRAQTEIQRQIVEVVGAWVSNPAFDPKGWDIPRDSAAELDVINTSIDAGVACLTPDVVPASSDLGRAFSEASGDLYWAVIGYRAIEPVLSQMEANECAGKAVFALGGASGAVGSYARKLTEGETPDLSPDLKESRCEAVVTALSAEQDPR